ncbi:MAG: cation:proton antiporter [Armatimonadetes bacterium]|nr:cation:proton antiporter [Armatimonadota bacterium]
MITRNFRRTNLMILAILAALCCAAMAAGTSSGHGSMDFSSLLLGLVVILIAAKIGGDLFARIGQPAVLGELVFGIIVGNLYLTGFHGLDFIKSDPNIKMLSEIGVMFLLFQVGLESDLAKMIKVGPSSLAVATLGIIAPFFLGWGVAAVFLPSETIYVHIFIGAILCATSVGITARVLRDLGRIQTPEARIILGAAVIDDVQGLIILAVISGIIKSLSGGAAISSIAILIIVAKAALFLVGAIVIGRWLAPRVFQFTSRLKAADLLLTTALTICFGFAYLSSRLGIAPIVGAFAAGLILDEVHWRSLSDAGERSIEELIRPLGALLVPIFFIRMGSEVSLATFANLSVLAFAGVLTLAAILGKQICGLGVMQKGLDRLTVGIGMIPRGEVGLIFASIGASLVIDGQKIVNQNTFSAVVIMVVITTMITPPLLKWSLARREKAAPEF